MGLDEFYIYVLKQIRLMNIAEIRGVTRSVSRSKIGHPWKDYLYPRLKTAVSNLPAESFKVKRRSVRWKHEFAPIGQHNRKAGVEASGFS